MLFRSLTQLAVTITIFTLAKGDKHAYIAAYQNVNIVTT